MKYLKLFEYYNQLEAKLAEYKIENYTINNDNTIDVNGDINLFDKKLTEIPFQFGKVEGSFYCSYNKLISLKGSPNYVGGDFNCYCNKLTTLEYTPKYVGSDFNCSNSRLTSLEGCPTYVGGNFDCSYNDIRYIPPDMDIEGDFYIDNNPIDIIFRHDINNKQILEELAIYNPISKDGLTVYKTKLKDMYRELGLLNKFDNNIKKLSNHYNIY